MRDPADGMTVDAFTGETHKPHSPRYILPRGYVAPPGTGPAGSKCATCKHAARSKRYAKCCHPMMEYRHTRGRAGDILLRSPGCSKWEAKESASFPAQE